MDDGLVLNLASEDFGSSKANSKKGGRWTDRVKAKRVAKRKTRPDEKTAPAAGPSAPPPAKKARVEAQPAAAAQSKQSSAPLPSQQDARPAQVQAPKPTGQIISSLFTYNPRVETPVASTVPKIISLPSNAPLADSSTFAGLGLDPLIISHLNTKMSIEKPTSIQRATLPAMLPSAPADIAARDIFIQSQTGSGKTLSFLLPIISDLLPLGKLSYIDRSIGTLAIIIAPTRELAKQISDVLEALLKLRLRPEDESPDDPTASARLTRWMVSGLLTGGATRNHEKGRLRKGVPIIVSTPGRLLDHLQNTSSFNVAKCRWLVLDEADRLMELGFEETITGIIGGLDARKRLALKAIEEGRSMEVGGWDWERRRRTVLCSATIREDVQKLAGTALIKPLMIKGTDVEKVIVAPPATPVTQEEAMVAVNANSEKFTPPTQLSQKYVIVPLKLRLVALVALLRSLLAQSAGRKGTKIIVFLSCTDSVDFHWNLLGGATMDGEQESPADAEESDSDEDSDEDSDNEKADKKAAADAAKLDRVELTSSLLPDASIFRLHGSLPTPTRLASLRGFSAVPGSKSKAAPISSSSILLCTSVASRGLDLPLVKAVVQYDLPTEGGATEYVHRVGRTARVGKGGEAWSIVLPSETEWVKWVEGKMRGEAEDYVPGDEERNITLDGVSMETVLKNGFGGRGSEYEQRATDVQLSFERWLLRRKENAGMARKAFLSHMRAYSTHPTNEKHIFHIRHLHLGHLAKAFALREAPKAVTGAGIESGNGKKKREREVVKTKKERPKEQSKSKARNWEENHSGEAEKRMQEIVRAQGKLTKKGGVMMSSGTSEFQIAGGSALEKLVHGSGRG